MDEFEALKEILGRISRELDQVQDSIRTIDKRESDNHLLAVRERTQLKGEIQSIQDKVSSIMGLVSDNKKGVYWLAGAAILGGALASGKIDKLLSLLPGYKH